MVDPSGTLEAVAAHLRGRGVVPLDALTAALLRSRSDGERLVSSLVRIDGISGDSIVWQFLNEPEADGIEVDGTPLNPRVVHLVPESQAFELKLLPIARTDRILWAAVPFRWDRTGDLAALERRVGLHLEPIPVRDLDVPGTLVKCHQLLRARSRGERRMGAALVARGLITRVQLQEGLTLHKQKGVRLGQALIELGHVRAEDFYGVLAERLHLPLLDNMHVAAKLDPQVARRITPSFAEHNMLLPYFMEGDRVRVAVSYPQDPNTLETVKAVTGARTVELGLVDEIGLRAVIQAVFAGDGPDPSRSRGETTTRVRPAEPPKAEFEVEDLSVEDEHVDVDQLDIAELHDPSVPKTINYMLYHAVKKGASDIHIEQYEGHVDIKFRVDGQLRVQENIPVTPENVLRVISKIKIDCKLDIAERRKPQDGGFRKRFGDKLLVDFRVAVQPTLYGENVVMRILDRTSPLPTLAQLGMPEEMLRRYIRLISNPQGLIVFTGPTGSGKTTTLYCTLEVLRKQQLKIITAEDPVEYQFDGIQQCQVNELIGNTFAKYLRGFLRQDPDVILIGEVRDQETCVMATRAAITGHLIFTTIHANDSVGVVRRLIDMGVDPNMLSNSLLGVVYQRLVRRICAGCKAPIQEDRAVLEELRLTELVGTSALYRGAGCAACDGEGYRGRIAIYELWEPNEEVRDAISGAPDDRHLRQVASQRGLKPLAVDGLAKVRAGVTTLEELQEVVPHDQIVRAGDLRS